MIAESNEPARTEAVSKHGLRDRLQLVLGSMSNAEIERLTGFNQETIRRYRRTGEMKAAFVTAVAIQLDVNADWLLTGRGTPDPAEDMKQRFIEQLRRLAISIEDPTGHSLGQPKAEMTHRRETNEK